MQGTRKAVGVAALALTLVAPAALADGWLSVGTGGVYIDDPGSSSGKARGTGHVALTFSDQLALRVRGTAFGYAGNTAVEQAVLIGFRMGRRSAGILLAGYSKLDDVSATEDNSNGWGLELLYAPRGRGAVSYEASLHGNINSDQSFGGLLLAARFGSMGRQSSGKRKGGSQPAAPADASPAPAPEAHR